VTVQAGFNGGLLALELPRSSSNGYLSAPLSEAAPVAKIEIEISSSYTPTRSIVKRLLQTAKNLGRNPDWPPYRDQSPSHRARARLRIQLTCYLLCGHRTLGHVGPSILV